MDIVSVNHILEAEGLGTPTLKALIPNTDNYKTLLMQPKGNIEADQDGVRNFDRDLAIKQFGNFLSLAIDSQADLAVTPEYSMPWNVLIEAIANGLEPAPGKLWVFGCESIKLGELETAKATIAPEATLLYQSLEPRHDGFLCPLAYVFLAPKQNADGENRLVVLCQFKTIPLGDPDNFEVNYLRRGSHVYEFGNSNGQEIKLISLICSDVFEFLDTDATAVYDRALIIHVQLNPKPRHENFRMYRGRLLRFHGDATEIICLNWASNIRLQADGQARPWKNIAGSAWYLKPDEFDNRDETLCANHRRGLYYTWLKELRVHALFFNYEPCVYLLDATKVVHIGVPGPLSRRRGPQLVRTYLWDTQNELWEEQALIQDGFVDVVGNSGQAEQSIRNISDQNPFSAERVLALCSGKIRNQDDWHAVIQLESCTIDSSEIIFRLTFCQDPDPNAASFRTAHLRRCSHLWNILADIPNLPPAIKDFSDGFNLDWQSDTPHQNAISEKGERATVVYMGEDTNLTQIEMVKKSLAERLYRANGNSDNSHRVRQRLVVWYRDDSGNIVEFDPYAYSRIDETGDASEFDIGRAE